MCLGQVGVVTRVWEEGGVPLALVDVDSGTVTACLLAAPEVVEGTSVLLHLGFVVEVLDSASANEARRLRAEAMSKEERT
jgi:hydrogenase maturation factor